MRTVLWRELLQLYSVTQEGRTERMNAHANHIFMYTTANINIQQPLLRPHVNQSLPPSSSAAPLGLP